MKPKAISIEQLEAKPLSIVGQARRGPVIIREDDGDLFVLRKLVDDDLADEILLRHPRFRASLKAAMKRTAKGKGVPLAEARRILGV